MYVSESGVILTVDDTHLWLIWTKIHGTYSFFMNLANVPLLHMWPVLDAVSLVRAENFNSF